VDEISSHLYRNYCECYCVAVAVSVSRDGQQACLCLWPHYVMMSLVCPCADWHSVGHYLGLDVHDTPLIAHDT
jgi:hypothetical protein